MWAKSDFKLKIVGHRIGIIWAKQMFLKTRKQTIPAGKSFEMQKSDQDLKLRPYVLSFFSRSLHFTKAKIKKSVTDSK